MTCVFLGALCGLSTMVSRGVSFDWSSDLSEFVNVGIHAMKTLTCGPSAHVEDGSARLDAVVDMVMERDGDGCVCDSVMDDGSDVDGGVCDGVVDRDGDGMEDGVEEFRADDSVVDGISFSLPLETSFDLVDSTFDSVTEPAPVTPELDIDILPVTVPELDVDITDVTVDQVVEVSVPVVPARVLYPPSSDPAVRISRVSGRTIRKPLRYRD
ncbi:hypothetical protein ACF0H5_006339 [Mactra antiquata]